MDFNVKRLNDDDTEKVFGVGRLGIPLDHFHGRHFGSSPGNSHMRRGAGRKIYDIWLTLHQTLLRMRQFLRNRQGDDSKWWPRMWSERYDVTIVNYKWKIRIFVTIERFRFAPRTWWLMNGTCCISNQMEVNQMQWAYLLLPHEILRGSQDGGDH